MNTVGKVMQGFAIGVGVIIVAGVGWSLAGMGADALRWLRGQS